MSRILVVDDEPAFPELVRALLAPSHSIDVVHGIDEARSRLERVSYDMVLTDLNFPEGRTGIELIAEATRAGVDVPFVVLTGHATIETAVDAMRQGAFDYLRKTASADELRQAVARALEHGRMAREVARLQKEVANVRGVPSGGFVGQSAALKATVALAERVAASDASVLLLGESGVGKELVARFIHDVSPRRRRPFIAFDCSALSPALIESELFGHEKGAFTGADRARRGLFREADGGTLFLDEIGDVAPEVQNKLLRVLQEREVRPVGSDVTIAVDVRMIAATNKDLKERIRAGTFREDLYYRLATFPIEIPPLRDRKGDIADLANYFLAERKRPGKALRRVSAEALKVLESYSWPGNVRELENVMAQADVLAENDLIQPADLPALKGQLKVSARANTFLPLRERITRVVQEIEREAIVEALGLESGSASRAAKRLGMSRAAFYNKMRDLNIEP